MFPFFSRNKNSSVLVQPLYLVGQNVAFTCSEVLESGQELRVRDAAGGEAGVRVQERRHAEDQEWIYFALVLDGELEPESTSTVHQWRRTPRFPCGVRVRSPQLPGYSAITEDLSPEGARLQTTAPLAVGQQIEVCLDLDDGSPELRGLARVCWSRMTEPCRAGLSFVDLDSEQLALLRHYLVEQTGTAVLPGLAVDPDPDEVAVEPALLEKLAYLKTSFNDGDNLVIKLITHDEVMEIRFPNPQVMQSNLTSRMVGRIANQVTPEGRTHTWLLDRDEATLVEIQSGSPEIVCRARGADDGV